MKYFGKFNISRIADDARSCAIVSFICCRISSITGVANNLRIPDAEVGLPRFPLSEDGRRRASRFIISIHAQDDEG